ncbi:MAG: UDP-2,4-diacetamido-2,4,6-trideoxy-beta-L-altropyranose hydrolase [Sphingobacteriales bacterium]|nr:MAG: UDP-2,4-diacetamido-2,4,6-trideoxy-beta-L-altropyranose hydrolase [Sphingobacteriales bacterium]
MRIAIRVDASDRIGSGHVMRCLTLAERLRETGAEVLFVCRNHTGNMQGTVKQRGFSLAALPLVQTADDLVGYALWLGVDPALDALQTRAAIASNGWDKIDWLVVDHYGLDVSWECDLRDMVARIAVIDDLADREHDCDVLVDQNLVADFGSRYNRLLPARAKRLLGPGYALLQPDYAALAASRKTRRMQGRVLVFLGGVDQGLTLKAVQGYVAVDRFGLTCDVVVSSMNPDLSEIERIAAERSDIRVFASIPSLAPLMVEADIAVGAGGATSWERLCLGVRALVVVLAENQRPIAEELSRRGLVSVVGDVGSVEADDFSSAIDAEFARAAAPLEARDLVDGLGAARVVSAMVNG